MPAQARRVCEKTGSLYRDAGGPSVDRRRGIGPHGRRARDHCQMVLVTCDCDAIAGIGRARPPVLVVIDAAMAHGSCAARVRGAVLSADKGDR